MLSKSTIEIIEDMLVNGQRLCPVCRFKNDCQEQCVDTVGLMDHIVIQDKDALINQLLLISQEEE